MFKKLNKTKYKYFCKKNKGISIIFFVVGFLAFFCLVFAFLYEDLIKANTVILNAGESVHGEKFNRTLSYKGNSIKINSCIKNILLIGIDTFDQTPINKSDSYYNYQQADFLVLITVNTKSDEISILHINRDTMTDVPWLTINGKVGGINFEQIALSHTYGSGREDSCRNTVNTASNLMFDLPINNYISLSMKGLPLLNDAVGGVSVYIEDDFSDVDPSLTKGKEVRLKGNQALTFVRLRKEIGDGTNRERMNRQKQYINGFINSYKNTSKDDDFYTNFINICADYMVTDYSIEGLINIMKQFDEFKIKRFVTLAGNTIINVKTNYVEFYVDKDILFEQLKTNLVN